LYAARFSAIIYIYFANNEFETWIFREQQIQTISRYPTPQVTVNANVCIRIKIAFATCIYTTRAPYITMLAFWATYMHLNDPTTPIG